MSEVNIAKTIEDKCFVMAVCMSDCSRHFNRIKQILILPLVIISSFLVILNGYENDADWLQFVNMSLNGLNVLLMGVQNQMRINEKCQQFSDLASKYTSLVNDISGKIAMNEIDAVYIHEISMKYQHLQTNDISIPNSIRKRIVNKYSGKRTIPNILLSSCDDSPNVSVDLNNRV